MKNKVLFIAFIGVAMLVSCGKKDKRKTFSDAVSYNDYVVACVNEVDQTYVNTLDVEKDKTTCLAWCDSLVSVSNRNLAKLNGIQPFKGDSSFTIAAKDFIVYMNSIGKKDIRDYLDLLFTEKMTDDVFDKVDKMATKLDGDYNKYFDKIEVAQKTLSIKYNFTISGK